jgi:hypothetical protein
MAGQPVGDDRVPPARRPFLRNLARKLPVASPPHERDPAVDDRGVDAVRLLQDPAREIFEVIRWFGERGKIFNVHFRNIKRKKLDFMEAFPDECDMDMPRALAAYRDVGSPHMLMPDHVPHTDRRPRPLGCRLRLLLRLHPGAHRRAGAAAGSFARLTERGRGSPAQSRLLDKLSPIRDISV